MVIKDYVINLCMNNKNKSTDYVKILNITALFCVLVVSFVPLVPVDVYSGTRDIVSYRPIYYTKYDSFFLLVLQRVQYSGYSSFLFGLLIISFYLTTICAFICVFIAQKTRFKIFLLLGALFMLISIFDWFYTASFSIIVSSLYLLLLIINIVVDTMMETITKSREAKDKKEQRRQIAYKIKDTRRRIGLTQKELADKAFISRSLVSKIESGNAYLSEENLRRIAAALGVDINYFYDSTPVDDGCMNSDNVVKEPQL